MPKRRVIAAFTLAASFAVIAACVGDEASSGSGRPEDAGQDSNVGTDANGTDANTATDAGADADADAAPACDRNAPFGTPTPVTGDINGTANDDGFWLLPDQLTVFTSSTRVVNGTVGGFDIFSGTRADVNSPFTKLVLAMTASTNGDDRAPTLTPDGKTIYFTRNPLPSGGYDIYVATRNSTAVAFDAPQPAAFPLNDSTNDFVSWASPPDPSGSYRVYFSSDRPGAASFDLYYSVKSAGGFAEPVAIPSLNSPSQDTKVVLTPDELQAFIASARTGTSGGQDIYYASRVDTMAGFSTPVRVAELNTPSNDLPMWVTPDGCTLYFSTEKPSGTDVYVATRGK